MISARVMQMFSKRGFVQLFWNDLASAQKKNAKTTHEEIYNQLENEYHIATGQRRYTSFKSFRRRRDEK